MYPGHVIISVDNWTDDVIDDVIMSKNISKYWTAVTSLISKLEGRPKAQNVANWTGYLDNMITSGDMYGEKVRPGLKFSSFFKISQFSI